MFDYITLALFSTRQLNHYTECTVQN